MIKYYTCTDVYSEKIMLIFDLVSPSLDVEYEISAPLQRGSCCGSSMSFDKAVYESTPRVTAATAPAPIQRGSWKTGSTSSTSSESQELRPDANITQ